MLRTVASAHTTSLSKSRELINVSRGADICELVPQLEYNIKLKLKYLLFYKYKGVAMSEAVTV